MDAGRAGDAACVADALGQRRQPGIVLERVAGRHQPPDPVELEPAQCRQARQAMSVMGGIEAAAEEAGGDHRMGCQSSR